MSSVSHSSSHENTEDINNNNKGPQQYDALLNHLNTHNSSTWVGASSSSSSCATSSLSSNVNLYQDDCDDNGVSTKGKDALTSDEERANADAKCATATDGAVAVIAIALPWKLRLVLAITSSIQAMTATVVSYYVVDNLFFTGAQMTRYWNYVSYAAYFSPLIGLLSDFLTFSGEQRRPVMIFGALLSMVCFLLIALVPAVTASYGLFLFISLVQNWAMTCVSVSLNGLVVELFLPQDGGSAVASVDENHHVDDDHLARVVVDAREARRHAPAAAVGADPLADERVSLLGDKSGSVIEDRGGSTGEEEQQDEGSHVPVTTPTVTLAMAAAVREQCRRAIMGQVQSDAMVFRSAGSLVGSLAYTIFVVWLPLHTMLHVSAGAFGLMALSVLILEHAWCLPRALPTLLTGGSDTASIVSTESFKEKLARGARRVATIARVLAADCDWRRPGDGALGFALVLVFVFIYTSTLDGSSVYFGYVATQFEFTNWYNALNSSFGSLGSVVSSFLYMRYMGTRSGAGWRAWVFGDPSGSAVDADGRPRRRTTALRIFAFGSIMAALGYGSNMLLATNVIPGRIAISPHVFVPADNFLTSLFSRFAFMPVLVVAAERCPAGYEAAVFELFSAASMGGGTVSSQLTAHLADRLGITYTDYSHLWILLAICAGNKLVPILLAWALPVRTNDKQKRGEKGTRKTLSKIAQGSLNCVADAADLAAGAMATLPSSEKSSCD